VATDLQRVPPPAAPASRPGEEVTGVRPVPPRTPWRRRSTPVAPALTLSARRFSYREVERGGREFPPEAAAARPRTYGECQRDGLGLADNPCPFVSCVHHLALDVEPRRGALKVNFPGVEIEDMAATCALRVAASGGEALERVGRLMNITRERVRQIEERGLARLRLAAGDLRAELTDDAHGPAPAPTEET
jgi:hypothetical protein